MFMAEGGHYQSRSKRAFTCHNQELLDFITHLNKDETSVCVFGRARTEFMYEEHDQGFITFARLLA